MEPQEPLPPPIWVDTAASFRAMVTYLREQPTIALDTESNSLFAYRERVCLIQISVPGFDYLVDPLAVRDLSALGPLLDDPDTLKILHGGEYDLNVLYRDYNFTFKNLFDTMWASRILGWPAFGLAALLKAQFGVTLNKRYQRANWGLRPLPPAQLDYARLDSHYLLPLARIQAEELEVKNRWRQAHHRFKLLSETRWEPKPFDPDAFWRINGIRDLDDAGRGVLRALFLFRDGKARASNRPPFKVISNWALLALSERRPSTLEGLVQVKGITPHLSRKYGRGLLRAIRQGSRQPLAWTDRPRSSNNSHRRTTGRPTPACQTRFEALRSWRNATAESKGVEPDIVLNNQTLWDVASANPRHMAGLRESKTLAFWEVEEFGPDLLRVLGKAPK